MAGTRVRLEVWDTAGQEEFASLSKFFLRNASGAFLLFDVTSRASFDQLQRVWVPRASRPRAQRAQRAPDPRPHAPPRHQGGGGCECVARRAQRPRGSRADAT